jgi:putative addiction module CopG family antidote
MPYQFPPDVEELIKLQMQSGGYGSEDDLLRDALQALEERRHAVLDEDAEVIAGIERGLADMNAGRSRPLDEFDAQFRKTHGIPCDG